MADEALSLRLEKYEGPLDLLLKLIEKNKINIYDIPIAEITEQYMAYLSGMEREDLDQLSEFLLMAATLLDIKARMLLPREVDQETGEEVDPRAELVNRLLEHKKYKLMAEELADREFDAYKVFFREPALPKEVAEWTQPVDLDELFQDVTLTRLQFVFQEVMRQREDRIDPERSRFGTIKREPISLKMQIEAVMSYARAHESFSFRDLLEKRRSKLLLVVTFLAVLELMKAGILTASQESPALDIYLEVSAEELENRHDFSELFDARLQDQVGQSEIIPPANCNEKIFGGVD